MIYFIGYIIGMLLTLICGLWYFSITRYKLYYEDLAFLLFVGVAFPIAVPMIFIINLPDLLCKPANFILRRMKKWRKKYNDR